MFQWRYFFNPLTHQNNTNMIMRHLGISFKALLFMGAAGISLAQDPGNPSVVSGDPLEQKSVLAGKQDEHFMLKHRMMAFREVDIDHDRKLAFSEFKQLKRIQNMETDKQRKLFDFLDQNHDGQLEINEVHPAKRRWALSDRKEFQRFDHDGDGCLDQVEFSQFLRVSKIHGLDAAKSFERLDQNKNGKIETFELGGKFRKLNNTKLDFASHDVDGNGGLDYAEYSQIPWVIRLPGERREKLFGLIDADGNGEISLMEIGNLRRDKRRPPGYSQHDREKKVGGRQKP